MAQPAADFIVETVRRHPGEVTLLAVGPLQNVADALRTEPNLGRLLKRVVLMSGNIYHSTWNEKPIAERNVVSATTDAQLMYAAGLPLTIVPLDSTTLVQLKDEERDRVRRYDSPHPRAGKPLPALAGRTRGENDASRPACRGGNRQPGQVLRSPGNASAEGGRQGLHAD